MHATARQGLRRAAATVGLVLSVVRLCGAGRLPLEALPVESPRWQDIDDLATTHGFAAAFTTTRPWSHAELCAFVDSLAARNPGVRTDPAWRRLAREARAGDDPRDPGPALRRAEDGRVLEASPLARVGWSEDHGTLALAHDHRVGARGALAFGDGLLLSGDVYAGTHSSGGHGNPTDSRRFAIVESADFNSYFDRSELTAATRLASATLGHTWLRWGPGLSGTLGLSDAAPALDLLALRVDPWRGLRWTWFVAELDPLADQWLAGHRLEARPARTLDVAFAELARFDGGTNAPLYLLPFVPYSHVEKRVELLSDVRDDSLRAARGKNNVMWTADASWRCLPGARLWGELLVDDISFGSTWRPRSIGGQAGGALRRRVGHGALAARAEWTRINRYTYSVWHHHDFVFGGLPLGYVDGPDVEHVEARLDWSPGADWTLGVRLVRVRHGEAGLGDAWPLDGPRVDDTALSGVVERTRTAELSLRWSPTAALEGVASGGWTAVEAPGHVAGTARSGAAGALRVDLRW